MSESYGQPFGQQPPPPQAGIPAQQPKSGSGLLKGCALGCVFLLVLSLVVAGLLYFGIQAFFNAAAGEARKAVPRAYEQIKADGRVPASHEALLDELVGYADNEDLGMFPSYLLLAAVVSSTSDGEISEQEDEMLNELAGIFRENPTPSMWTTFDFMSRYPDMQQELQQYQDPEVWQQWLGEGEFEALPAEGELPPAPEGEGAPA